MRQTSKNEIKEQARVSGEGDTQEIVKETEISLC